MLSHEYKCIYIHIPKTAGTSIENALLGQSENPVERGITDHKTAAYYKRKHGPLFEKYFVFSIVRNPWDRIYSIFSYYTNGGNQRDDLNIVRSIPDSFKGFCRKYLRNNRRLYFFGKPILWPQYRFLLVKKYLFFPSWKNSPIDYVGRFEKLEEDFNYIADRIKLPYRLPHVRRNQHDHYAGKYDSETISMVSAIYQKDIEMWGYEFGE